MIRKIHRVLTLLFCMAALLSSCLSAQNAQTEKTITIRMLDGKTGRLIATSNFLVRINHDQTLHADWVVQNEDGTGKLTLPKNGSLIAVQGTYDRSEEIYVNCDSASQKENPIDHWYAVSEIQTTGVIAPNSCVKPSESAKLRPVLKPGVFVFYVRKKNWREQSDEDFVAH